MRDDPPQGTSAFGLLNRRGLPTIAHLKDNEGMIEGAGAFAE